MPRDESEDDKPLYDESKDACNPENFANESFEYEEVVKV